jgi:putative membrane protein
MTDDRQALRWQWFPAFLFGTYLFVFVALGIAPYDRTVWIAENAPIMLIVLMLVGLYAGGVRFSNTAYLLMAVLIFMHTIGGHYTFARVPFDWFNDFFGFERNMYDRIAHFSVGFYAFAIAEVLARFRAVRSTTVFYLFPVFAIMALAVFYELFEWWFAVSSDPAAGIEVLGSQGDIWDAQQDMLADTLGAVTAMVGYRLMRRPTTGSESSNDVHA